MASLITQITPFEAILLCSSALLLWAALSGLALYKGGSAVRNALIKATQVTTPIGDVPSFTREYESISAALANIPVVRPSWLEFSSTLLLPAETCHPVQTPIRTRDCFHVDVLLRNAGVNLRYHAAMPNLLVGMGLLLTFIGIALALQVASHIAGPQTSDLVRNQELAKLLSTASFKFATSIAGLSLSICYTLCRQYWLQLIETQLESFLSTLDRVIPLITTMSLQRETNHLLDDQSDILEAFSNDLAVAIGKELDSKFDARLGEHIKPLTVAMQHLAQNLSKGTDDALQQLVTRFIDALQGRASGGMDDVVEKLGGLATSLQSLQQGLNDAASLMTASAEKMVDGMRNGADETLKRMADQMVGLIESLRDLTEQTRSAGENAGHELAAQITQACAGFEAMARSVSSELAGAMAAMQREMGENTEESSRRLSLQLEATVTALSELAAASRKTSEVAFSDMLNQLSKAAESFEGAAAKVAASLEAAGASSTETFGRSATVAVERIARATESMQSQLETMFHKLGNDIQTAGTNIGETLTSSGAAAGESIISAGDGLRAHLEHFASTLTSAGDEAAQALKDGGAGARVNMEGGGATARAHMETGATLIGVRAREMAEQVAGLGASADRLQSAIGGFSTATNGVGAAIQAGAQDMMAASSLAHETLQPLKGVGAQIQAGLEQLHGASKHLNDAHIASKDLAAGLERAAGRFEGVDKSLSSTLASLQNGLQGFAEQVSKTVTETDKHLAQAATNLSSGVTSLDETLEELKGSFEKLVDRFPAAGNAPRRN